MSIETYEKMIDIAKTDVAISEAEREYEADSVLLEARDALASLYKKYFSAVRN